MELVFRDIMRSSWLAKRAKERQKAKRRPKKAKTEAKAAEEKDMEDMGRGVQAAKGSMGAAAP
jgi:hypothetical protein